MTFAELWAHYFGYRFYMHHEQALAMYSGEDKVGLVKSWLRWEEEPRLIPKGKRIKVTKIKEFIAECMIRGLIEP